MRIARHFFFRIENQLVGIYQYKYSQFYVPVGLRPLRHWNPTETL